jgi:hypothetical protein
VLAAAAVSTRNQICQRRSIDHKQRQTACVLTSSGGAGGGCCKHTQSINLSEKIYRSQATEIARVLTSGSSSSGGGCRYSNHGCCCNHKQSVREGLSITSNGRLPVYLRAVAVLAAAAVSTRNQICQRRSIDHKQRRLRVCLRAVAVAPVAAVAAA